MAPYSQTVLERAIRIFCLWTNNTLTLMGLVGYCEANGISIYIYICIYVSLPPKEVQQTMQLLYIYVYIYIYIYMNICFVATERSSTDDATAKFDNYDDADDFFC